MRAIYTMALAVNSTEEAFKIYSAGGAQVPLRVNIPTPHGSTLFMPAAAGDACGCKIVCVRLDNPKKGLPTIPALHVVIDEETGFPTALLDGQTLTYFRTGAASGVAVKNLVRKDAKILLVVGTGFQGVAGCEAALAAHKFEKVIGVDAYEPSLERFANWCKERKLQYETHKISELPNLVPKADVIITTTTSPEPLFDGNLVKPGTLVSCVGAYQPHTREVDSVLMKRANKVVCDTFVGALAEAGDLLIPISEGVLNKESVVEIGSIANGAVKGRESDDDIIVFKTTGSAVQDAVVGHAIAKLAEEKGVGQTVDM